MSAAAPDYIEPVQGWRAWLVLEHPTGLQLRSITRPLHWPPRQAVTATCARRQRILRRPARHLAAAPDPDCGCGIYAARQVETAIAYADCCDPDIDRVVCRVVGRVALWGTVVECSDGWRAEHAYPAELVVPVWERGGIDVDRLQEGLGGYGIPVQTAAASSRRSLALALGGSGELPRRRLLR